MVHRDAALLKVVRTDSDDAAFRTLVQGLDQDLALRNGDKNAFFAQYNKLDLIRNVVVVMDGHTPVGCGAFKPFGTDAVEIKRMFVPATHRQRGIASRVLQELERWAGELGHTRCVLETGRKQTEAIALYTKKDYEVVPNYGPYVGVAESVCFAKVIT